MKRYVIQVTDDFIDPVFEHVDHTRITRILWDVRLLFMQDIGYPEVEFRAAGLFFVLGKLAIEFKRELKPGVVVVSCAVNGFARKKVLLEQVIYNEKKKIAVIAQTESALLDRSTGRATEIPERLMELLRDAGIPQV